VATSQPWNSVLTNGWKIAGRPEDATIVSDPTAPTGAGSVLQITYPAGFAAGSAPATAYYDFSPLAREVFVGMWWEPSPNWQGHSSGVNKIQFLMPSSGTDMYMAMYGSPGGPYQIRVIAQWPESPDWFKPNAADVPIQLGQWHRLEWYVRYESAYGAADGVVRWWVDGQLVGNYTNVRFPNDRGFIEHQLSPTWGGMGETKNHTDWFRFDHVSVMRK
jgi:hypothetical protein